MGRVISSNMNDAFFTGQAKHSCNLSRRSRRDVLLRSAGHLILKKYNSDNGKAQAVSQVPSFAHYQCGRHQF